MKRRQPRPTDRCALGAGLAALMMLAAACAPVADARVNQQPASAAPTAVEPSAPTPGPTPSPTVAPLTGELTREALQALAGWEPLRPEDYTPDPAAIAAIREASDGIDVFVFLGTWCSDSRREVPRFFAIMDQAGLADKRTTLLGLDRSKKDAEGLAVAFGVRYVPTFIVFKEGREVGRIVEKPVGTLEGDLAQIMIQAKAAAENPNLFAGAVGCH